MEAKETVTPEITISVPATKAKESKKGTVATTVEIVPNTSFKIMFGDRWYYFTKGVAVKVPQEMKEYLRKQGALAVI